MNFFVKNLFSKCKNIRIKLRIYSYLSNKSLTENFFFCREYYWFYYSIVIWYFIERNPIAS